MLRLKCSLTCLELERDAVHACRSMLDFDTAGRDCDHAWTGNAVSADLFSQHNRSSDHQ